MYKGKQTCKTLKGIRKKIADANEIIYEPKECTHKGDCAGTCPACEAEVKYLERQLNLRRMAGKAVAIVGLSLGLTAITSCGTRNSGGSVPNPDATDSVEIERDVVGIVPVDTSAIPKNISPQMLTDPSGYAETPPEEESQQCTETKEKK